MAHNSTDSAGVEDGVSGGRKKEPRLLERYMLQEKVVQALENTEYHRHLAGKVQNCHKRFRHKRCDQNHHWAAVVQHRSCAVRICPHCAHRRARILAVRTQALIEGKTGLRYAVLAEKNSKSLQQGIASLWNVWTSLRRSVCWKRKVKGCVVALEVTYNSEKRTWHPHLNVLMEGEYFPFEELNQAWIKATKGNGRTSRIEAADEGTVFELLKYTLKIATRDQDAGEFRLILREPPAIDEFLSAIHGSRLVRSYGSLYGLKVEDEEKPEEERERCPDCSSISIVDLGAVYHSQLSFDFSKDVFRIVGPPAQADVAMHLVRRREWIDKLVSDPASIAIAVEARRRATRYEKQISLLFAS